MDVLKKSYTADAWRITWAVVGGSRRVKFFRDSKSALAHKERLTTASMTLGIGFETKPVIEKVEFEA